MPRNALCRGAFGQCTAVRIVRMTSKFAAVADDAQAGNPAAKPAFAGFAGFAWVIIVREGPSFPKSDTGARARRFDSVRVQTEVCRVCSCTPAMLGGRRNAAPVLVWLQSCGRPRVRTCVRTQCAGTHPHSATTSNGRRMGVEFTTLESKNGDPCSNQHWRGFSAISGPKNGKTATVKFGRRKGLRYAQTLGWFAVRRCDMPVARPLSSR